MLGDHCAPAVGVFEGSACGWWCKWCFQCISLSLQKYTISLNIHTVNLTPVSESTGLWIWQHLLKEDTKTFALANAGVACQGCYKLWFSLAFRHSILALEPLCPWLTAPSPQTVSKVMKYHNCSTKLKIYSASHDLGQDLSNQLTDHWDSILHSHVLCSERFWNFLGSRLRTAKRLSLVHEYERQ